MAPATGSSIWRERPLVKLILGRLERAQSLGDELKLSDAQRQAIRSVLLSCRAELAAAIKPVVMQGRVLRQAVSTEPTDEAAIRSAANELGKRLGDASVTVAKVRQEVKQKAQLTDDQLNALRQFRLDNASAVDSWLDGLSEQ